MLNACRQRTPRSFESLIKNHTSYKAFLDRDAVSDPQLRDARIERLRHYYNVGKAWAELDRTRCMPEMPIRRSSNFPPMLVEPCEIMANFTMETGRAMAQLEAAVL